MKKVLTSILMAALVAGIWSCSKTGKDEPKPTPTPPQPPAPTEKVLDYSKASLKELAAKQGIKLGVAMTYGEYRQNPAIAGLLEREFSSVTFGNEMKHDCIVGADGKCNFSTADAMVSYASKAGVDLFGHTLGWHSQQQNDYLDKLVSKARPDNSASLLQTNWNFEEGTLDGYVANGFGLTSSYYEVFAGDYAAKAESEASLGFKVSLAEGKTYELSFWAMSEASDRSVKASSGNQETTASLTSKWTKYSTSFTAAADGEAEFTLEAAAGACIDNIRVVLAGGQSAPVGKFYSSSLLEGELADDAIGFAYKSWVYAMIEHFDAYGWDVVNETFSDAYPSGFRDKNNTDLSGYHKFLWGLYFGNQKNFVDKAFAYAKDALAKYGKEAVLYINDYNLEYSDSKLGAYCDYAKNNPDVTGVGTQMHLDLQLPNLESKIDNMLRMLTGTGKLVRISELDIKAGNSKLKEQAELYKYIFQKYIEIVPEAQRGGITFWGFNDKDSWVGESNHPLLWSGKNYAKKPAYDAIYIYLCELAGIDPYKASE